MRYYQIITFPSCEQIDWTQVTKAPVDQFRWAVNGYTPKTYAQLAFVRGGVFFGFVLRMTCCEQDPCRVFSQAGDPVYLDSCMEFFAQFVKTDARYVNLEMNANGAALCCIGPNRNARIPVAELLGRGIDVHATLADGEWSVMVELPLDRLVTLYKGAVTTDQFCSGYRFRGNFYKCGDDCPKPHFGMWSLVETDTPDFHRPEFFGEFEIV